MPFQAIRYIMNSISGLLVEAAMLVSIYHLWGWRPLFWTALVLCVLQSIGLTAYADNVTKESAKRAEG